MPHCLEMVIFITYHGARVQYGPRVSALWSVGARWNHVTREGSPCGLRVLHHM